MKRTISAIAVAAIVLIAVLARAESAMPVPDGHTAYAELKSGVVDAVGYSLDKHAMTVLFQSGLIYVYDEVPESVFSALINAERPGNFFVKNIRGKFASRQMASCERSELAGANNPQGGF